MIRNLILAAAAVLALSGCDFTKTGLPSLPPPPAAVADATTLDEQAALGVELAYQAARTAAEVAVDAGLIKGATASRLAQLDRQAFLAVTVVRQAYRTGNADSYGSALADARQTITALLALIKGN